MIKLIAIDIDGTLLNSQRQLTERVKNALLEAKNQGVKVVLCTGRPIKGVKDLLNELTLNEKDQYVITFNGALALTGDGSETIVSNGMNLEDYEIVKTFAEQHNTHYHAADLDVMYTSQREIGVYMAHEANLVNMPIYVRTIEELRQLNINIQKMMITDYSAVLDGIIEQVPQSLKERFLLVKSAPYYLEVLNPKANKGDAVMALAAHLGIDIEDVMAIGDNYNDMDMIKIAGYSVAMGNAVQAIKDAAKYHTGTNDEDGVAQIVEKLVLQ